MHMPRSARIVLFLLLLTPALSYGDILKLDTDTSLRAVYLIPDDDAELVTVAMVIMAGEVNARGPEGLSHYLEHLVFWHADNVKGEPIHARDGNAWVNGLVTSYYNRGEISELDDMVEFARRVLTPPELARNFMLGERDVVNREYDLRVSENPDWRVLTDLHKGLYADHPASRSVIGSRESIGALSILQAFNFHQSFYHGTNSVLIIKGNVSEKQIVNLVNSRFSSLPGSEELIDTSNTQAWRQSTVSGSLDEVKDYREKQAASERVIYTSLSNWTSEQDSLQGLYTLIFARKLLESALPGSLAKPLRLDNFIISRYDIGINRIIDEQIELNIFAVPDDGISLETANLSLSDALAQLGAEGVPQKSFDRIKKRWLQTAKREASDLETLLWRTWWHISSGVEPNDNLDHLQRIESVNLSDLNSLMAALGKPQRKNVGLIKGE